MRRCRHAHERRSGTVIFAALICLLVIATLAGTMLQFALLCRRQMHVEQDALQAEQLLQAGIDRARRRMATEPGYAGETWTPQIGSNGEQGQVRIVLMKDLRESATRTEVLRSYAKFTAEYPLGNARSVRRSEQISIQPFTQSSTSRNEE
jgi:type II secretory pathway component PulK